MNRTKLGFIALIFLFGAAILVPVLLTDTASAFCGACVRDCDSCVIHDCDSCVVRDCDSCDRCSNVSHFRCDLYRCSWVGDFDACQRCYGCAAGRLK